MAEELNYAQALRRAWQVACQNCESYLRQAGQVRTRLLLPGYNSLGVSALPNQTAAKHFNIPKSGSKISNSGNNYIKLQVHESVN